MDGRHSWQHSRAQTASPLLPSNCRSACCVSLQSIRHVSDHAVALGLLWCCRRSMGTAGWQWWGMVQQTWRRACLMQPTSSLGRCSLPCAYFKALLLLWCASVTQCSRVYRQQHARLPVVTGHCTWKRLTWQLAPWLAAACLNTFVGVTRLRSDLLCVLSPPCWRRYGGVVERPNIAAQADWYLYSIQPLIDALN